MENQTNSVLKSGMDFNQPIPGQREEMPLLKSTQTPAVDFCEIKGQCLDKRVLEIAAAGSHHTMLIGPTGSGKTMFIKAFPSILPEKNNKKERSHEGIYNAVKSAKGHEEIKRRR